MSKLLHEKNYFVNKTWGDNDKPKRKGKEKYKNQPNIKTQSQLCYITSP